MLRDGAILIGKGLVADHDLTETAFLAAFEEAARPLVHNGIHRSYVVPVVMVEGRAFIPALYFTDGALTFINMVWSDPGSTPSWENWSADRQKEIARMDAAWLSSALGGVGTMTNTYTFPWGTLASGFNDRDGSSSVTIRYR